MSEVATTDVQGVMDEPANAGPVSLIDHAAQYGQRETEKPESTDEQPRGERGKFAPKRRAQSSNATPQDVDAINTWTRELKTAEEGLTDIERKEGESDRVFTLRRRAEAVKRAAEASKATARVRELEAEVETLRRQGAPKAQIAKAEAKAEQAEATADPEPSPDDAKYDGDYTAFVKDHNKWAARDAIRQDRELSAKQQAEAKKRQDTEKSLGEFRTRVDAARAKYADFDAVALAPSRIPEGSAIDAFVMDDDAGPEVLYHLHKNPQELDELLHMGPLKQLKALSLLSQRLSSASGHGSGTTGAEPVARSAVKPPPKPPTPVRTEAQRPADSPPPSDGSLSVRAHYKAFHTKR